MSDILLRLAGILGASVSIHLAVLPSALLTESDFRQVTGRFLNLETKGLGFNLVPEATSGPLLWSGEGHASRQGRVASRRNGQRDPVSGTVRNDDRVHAAAAE